MRKEFLTKVWLGCLLSLLTVNVCAELQAPNNKSRERARDGIVHIEKELVLDIPQVSRLCDQTDIVKRRVNVGDCELYCEIEGNGVPMVLLHGGPGATHHYFHPSFSQAKNFAKIIYYDQRGCGISDYKKGKGYSIEQAVDDLESLRQSLNINKWVVLGWSYGGVLAQSYVAKYPNSVSGLILVCSGVAAMGFAPDLLRICSGNQMKHAQYQQLNIDKLLDGGQRVQRAGLIRGALLLLVVLFRSPG